MTFLAKNKHKLALMTLLLFPGASFADALKNPVATIVSLEGEVSIANRNSEEPLTPLGNIYEGETIRTRDAGRIKFQYLDGTVILLMQNSSLKTQEFQYNRSYAQRQINIELGNGLLRISSEPAKGKSQTIRLRTPVAEFETQAMDAIVSSAEDGESSQITVIGGQTTVRNLMQGGEPVQVSASKMLNISMNAATGQPVSFSENTAKNLIQSVDLVPEDLLGDKTEILSLITDQMEYVFLQTGRLFQRPIMPALAPQQSWQIVDHSLVPSAIQTPKSGSLNIKLKLPALQDGQVIGEAP